MIFIIVMYPFINFWIYVSDIFSFPLSFGVGLALLYGYVYLGSVTSATSSNVLSSS